METIVEQRIAILGLTLICICSSLIVKDESPFGMIGYLIRKLKEEYKK